MAEVGVLELTIKDNSEQAAGGLKALDGAIRGIKEAVGKGMGLSPVSRSIKALNDQVASSMPVVKQLASLFNALSSFGRLKNFSIDTKQFSELKDAINGMSIGQTGTQLENIRKALGGEWNTENVSSAMTAMNAVQSAAAGWKEAGTAATITAVAKSIEKYNAAVSGVSGDSPFMMVISKLQTDVETVKSGAEDMKQATDNWLGDIFNKEKRIGEYAGEGTAEGINTAQSNVADASARMAEIIPQTMRERLQEHSPSKVTKKIGEYAGQGFVEGIRGKEGDARSAAADLADAAKEALKMAGGLTKVASTVQQSVNGMSEMSAQAEKAQKEIATLMENLRKPIDYSGFQKINEVRDTAEESAKALSVAAMDKDGPFVFASEEIMHFSGLLNRAREDLAFWEEEYSKTAKAIKYNGATEEQNNMLGHSEEAFYIALQQVEEYENKIREVKEYVASLNIESSKVTKEQEKYNALCDEAIQKAAELSREIGAKYDQAKQYGPTDLSDGGIMSRSLLGLEGVKLQMIAIQRESERTGESVDEVKQRIQEFMSGDGSKNNVVEGLESVDEIAGITKEELAALEAKVKAQNQLFDNYGNVDKLVNDMSYAQANITSNVTSMQQQIERLIQAEEEMKMALAADISAGLQDSQQIAARLATIRMLTEEKDRAVQKLKEYANAQRLASKVSSGLQNAFNDLKKGIKSMFPSLTRLSNQFKSIARRMAIRAIIKQVTSAFREGVENVYHYSDAIGTDFADNMDSAASKLQQMRNSIGAAVAPVIQALIPILQTVVSWVITAMNYINQFFALLSGQTQWTRALETATTAYEKSAKKASKATSDWLADFDELNVMSNGAGGGVADKIEQDYSKMFEQVEEFDSKVKDIVKWIQEHMDTVLGIAKAVGIAILGWKISQAFSGVVGTLGDLLRDSAIATIGLQLTYTGAFDAGLNGEFSAGDLISTIGGIIMSAVGMALIGYKVSKTWGALAGGAAGLTIGLAVAYYAYKKGTATAAAKLAFAKSGEGGIDPDEYLKALQAEFDKRTAGAKLILDAYVDVPDIKKKLEEASNEIIEFNQKVFSGDGELTDDEVASFNRNWTTMMDLLDRMSNATYETLLGGAIAALQTDNENLRIEAEKARVNWIMASEHISEARAQWVKRTEDLKDKILNHTASGEEIEEYKNRLRYEKVESGEGMLYADGVNSIIENIDTINFGDADNALDKALEFVENVRESSSEAVATIREARKDVISAYKAQKDELDKYLLSDDITQEQYDGYMANLNAIFDVDIKFLDESESEIQDKVKEAYDRVFKQVDAVYKNLGSKEAKSNYWNLVMEPLMKRAESEGYSLPREMVDEYNDRVFASWSEMKISNNTNGIQKLAFEGANELFNMLFGDDVMDVAMEKVRNGQIFKPIQSMFINMLFGNMEEQRPLESTEDTKKYMAKYGMKDTLQALVDQYMAEHNVSQLSGMENSSKMFAYLFSSLEQTSTQGGVESLKESDISDIVNSLLLILPEYESGLLLNWLDEQREAFGDTFDFEKVVKLIDWKALSNRTGEEYDAEEFAKEVNSWIDTYNSKNPNGMQIEHITPDQLFVNPNGAGGTGGEADTEAAVESGVKKGFSGQMDNTDRILRDILTTVRRKQFVITPNTAMGRAASASMGMFGNVTGDDPHYIP